MLGCLTVGESRGRDDVPPEVAKLENPVAELPDSRVRYFARQFKGKCARCHGLKGNGGGDEAAGQTVPPTNFTDAAYMATRSDGQLYYQVLMGGGERCAMPAFGPESDHGWNDEKIWSMVHFVRRFSRSP
jgi:mono/diheme cytochrome c family protein